MLSSCLRHWYPCASYNRNQNRISISGPQRFKSKPITREAARRYYVLSSTENKVRTEVTKCLWTAPYHDLGKRESSNPFAIQETPRPITGSELRVQDPGEAWGNKLPSKARHTGPSHPEPRDTNAKGDCHPSCHDGAVGFCPWETEGLLAGTARPQDHTSPAPRGREGGPQGLSSEVPVPRRPPYEGDSVSSRARSRSFYAKNANWTKSQSLWALVSSFRKWWWCLFSLFHRGIRSLH